MTLTTSTRTLLGVIMTVASATPSRSGPVNAPPIPRSEPRQALKMFLKTYLRDSMQVVDSLTRYTAVPANLRGGEQTSIVYLNGGRWCGNAGCTMLVLREAGSSYEVIGNIKLVQLPIRVLPSTTHGWRDIAVRARTASGPPAARRAQISFDGRAYAGNPSMTPEARGPGRIVMPLSARGAPLYQ